VFFFQAEDGIRDRNVTGVQTCALPISIALTGLRSPEDAAGVVLNRRVRGELVGDGPGVAWHRGRDGVDLVDEQGQGAGYARLGEIGRASCREGGGGSGGGGAWRRERHE